MINGNRLVVVMPAYNAERTLRQTFAELPHEYVDETILVDDASRDATVQVAARAGHPDDHPPREPRLRRQPEDLLPRPRSPPGPTSS